MKKFFTLVMFACCALGINAQDETRKVWDFRQGFSQETIDNLTTAAANGLGYTNNYNAETGIGYFETKSRTAGPLTVKVNDEDWIVPELEGLTVGAQSNQHFNLVIGHKNLGPHIWLNGKKGEDYIQIDEPIPAGEKVVVIYSSHKDSEGRGFKVSGNFKDENGKQQWTISKRTDTEAVPDMYLDTVVVINTGEEAAKLKMSTTNGMHFHLIAIGGMPDAPQTKKQVAYLFDSAIEGYNADDDYIPGVLEEYLGKRIDAFELKSIDLAKKAISREDLETFDVVVLGNITTTNANVSVLKSAISYTPILNLGSGLYTTWKYGEPIATTQFSVNVAEAYRTNKLFASLDNAEESILAEDGTLKLLAEDAEPVNTVSFAPGSYFANDEVIATAAGDATAIHLHNLIGRNAYMLLPLDYGFIDDSNGGLDILVNAVAFVAATKRDVTKTAKPQIIPDYKDLKSVITLKCSTKDATIYYTLDGTDPTEQSAIYNGEEFTFTEKTTVKAVAHADGYNLSDISTLEVNIFRLAKTPVITVDQQEGKALVTITAEDEGAEIYFNLTGSKLKDQSQKYTEPFELAFNATVTAFVAELDELLQSELAQEVINIPGKTVRTKVLSAFKGGEHSIGNTLKNGFPFYTSDVIDTEIYKDINGEDSIVNVYAPSDSIYYYTQNKGWNAVTKGQPMVSSNATPSHNVGDFGGYNPESVFDDFDSKEITNNIFQFSGVNQSNGDGIKDPASAYIQTTEALQAPFDIVGYVGGKNARIIVSVNTDTLNVDGWTEIGTLVGGSKEGVDASGKDGSNRIWRKTILSYEGNEKVFVKCASDGRLANIFDIYVKGNDESEGIEDMQAATVKVATRGIYNINGVLQQSMRRGLNIIVGADGSVKKVFVK